MGLIWSWPAAWSWPDGTAFAQHCAPREMISIVVDTPLASAIAAASVHGLVDLYNPRKVVPYALLLAPIDSHVVTASFFLCSVRHFSHDTGLRLSLAMHAVWIALASIHPGAAWVSFALFYCGIHAPKHVLKQSSERVLLLLTVAIAVAFGTSGTSKFVLTDMLQIGVVAHVIADELVREQDSTEEQTRTQTQTHRVAAGGSDRRR